MKITGIKAAAGDFRRLPHGGYSGFRMELWFDKDTGEVWAKQLTSSSWTVYHNDSIIDLFRYAGEYEEVSMKNIKKWAERALADVDGEFYNSGLSYR